MKKLLYVLIALLFTSCIKKEKKCNVLFILIDDMGWKDLSYMGSEFYETPNIDDFAKNSIQFTNAYAAASVSSPSRASLLTGLNPARLNITDWIPGMDCKGKKLDTPQDLNALPLERTTLAEIYKNNGYNTYFLGKWHLGSDGYLPEDQGFQINIGGNINGQPLGGYFAPYKNSKIEDGIDGEYLQDRLTDESINLIKQNSNDPFFIFLSYYSVHGPIQAKQEDIIKFELKQKKLHIGEVETKPEHNSITRINQSDEVYAAMLFSLDRNIGRIIEALKTEGVYENTIIVFTSDNGGKSTLKSSHNKIAPTSVFPLRGGKGWLYEGGIRIPLLIKPVDYSGNEKITKPTIGYDLFPTLLAISDIKYQHHLDGKNIFQINNDSTRILFWHYPHYHGSGWTPGSAIRKGNWKLIEFYETESYELYNLSTDLFEQNNLINRYPKIAEILIIDLNNIKIEMNASKIKKY